MDETKLKLFEEVFMQSFSPTVITDANLSVGCHVLFANPAFCNMTGYTLDELVGDSLKKLQGYETEPKVISYLKRCLINGEFFVGSTINYKKDGSSYNVYWNISPIRDDNGEIIYFVSSQQDISSLINSTDKNILLAKSLDAVENPILLLDDKFNIEFTNTSFRKLISILFKESHIDNFKSIVNYSDEGFFFNKIKQAIQSKNYSCLSSIKNIKDSSVIHVEIKISPVYEDDRIISHYIVLFNDVSKNVEREQELIYISHHDPLTGLSNRSYGEKILTEYYSDARCNNIPLSLIFLDIDCFKNINDKYGHNTGDRILKSISKVLKKSFRTSDHIIRWGGEEFIILLNKCSLELAVDLSERIRKNVEDYSDDEVGKITISLGVATLQPNETIHELISRADSALYQSKRNGRNQLTISY